MLRHFIEARAVTSWLREHVSDADYARFQRLLGSEPDSGAVMPKCGGLRKVRIAETTSAKGKRGGGRIIYLHVPEAGRFYLVAAYSKGTKDKLTPHEQKALKALAAKLRQEALRLGAKTKGNDDA